MSEVSTRTKGRGWQGAVLKLFGADDFLFTVTRVETVTEHYIRIGFTGGGLLSKATLHPTMWVRMWFEGDNKLHQRGYTLVDPDPAADTFDIEFALHDGTAANWAREAQVGDRIAATLMGSKFAIPEPAPKGWIVAGDAASLAAINSLLDALSASDAPETPATIWLEHQYESDHDVPLRLRPQDTLHRVPRERDGAALVEAIKAAAVELPDHGGWVALDSASTRAVVACLKSDYRLGRKNIKSQAYWITNRSFG